MTPSNLDLAKDKVLLNAKLEDLSTEIGELRTQLEALSTEFHADQNFTSGYRQGLDARLKALELKVNSEEFHVEQSAPRHIPGYGGEQGEALRTKCHNLGISAIKLTDQLEATRAEYVELQAEKQGTERMLDSAEAECEALRAKLRRAEEDFAAIQEICDV